MVHTEDTPQNNRSLLRQYAPQIFREVAVKSLAQLLVTIVAMVVVFFYSQFQFGWFGPSKSAVGEGTTVIEKASRR